jgi:hypothetical protein
MPEFRSSSAENARVPETAMKTSDTDPVSAFTPPDLSTVTLVKEDIYDADAIDPVYREKARLISRALQDMGMGKYQVSHECFSFRLY